MRPDVYVLPLRASARFDQVSITADIFGRVPLQLIVSPTRDPVLTPVPRFDKPVVGVEPGPSNSSAHTRRQASLEDLGVLSSRARTTPPPTATDVGLIGLVGQFGGTTCNAERQHKVRIDHERWINHPTE